MFSQALILNNILLTTVAFNVSKETRICKNNMKQNTSYCPKLPYKYNIEIYKNLTHDIKLEFDLCEYICVHMPEK